MNPATLCPMCGAELRQGDARCWLCGHALDRPTSIVVPPLPAGTAPPAVGRTDSFSLETLMLVVTLIAICLGVFVQAPGLGILLCILALPAFVRTLLVVRRRGQLSRGVPLGQRIALFLGSLGFSLVVLILVVVSSVGVFCGVCLGLATVSTPDGTSISVALVAGVGAMIVVFALCVAWMRRRWVRDTEEIPPTPPPYPINRP